MKNLIAILSIAILASSSVFASQPSCENCESTTTENNSTASTLDILQQQSLEENNEYGSALTSIVLKKLNDRKTETTLQYLQKETEEISIAQPILWIATTIEKKFQKKNHQKHSCSGSASCSK